VAYGPDDPAYGPPGRDWYERAESEAARRQESEEELRQARGPFEPLPPDHEVTTPPPPDQQADQDIDPPADDLDVAVVGQGTGPLERIKDLYTTAEAIGERRLDKHFDQLLERQRQLISDYFANQEFRGPTGVGPIGASPAGPGPIGAAPTAPGPAGDPAGIAGPRNERAARRSRR
jgi:hypothetical protein